MLQALGFEPRNTCEHNWQPLSFVFETEVLSITGSCARPQIRQPSIDAGRVYCVCMLCASHTYIVTQWVGFYLGGDQDPNEDD
jgi:hypothetical protein